MRTRTVYVGFVALLMSAVLVAADPPYVGRWEVNGDKTDLGIALTFEPAESGDMRLLEGGRITTVRFDGKEYPHPLGGVSRWTRIDARTFETVYSQNGKVLGEVIYQLSDDAQTLTRRSKGATEATPYRRRSGAPQGLAGAWSLTAAAVPPVVIEVADGYDLIFRSGGATCKANFDGRDYAVIGPNGKPSDSEACRISKVGDRAVSMAVMVNGKAAANSTYTASADGKTLTQTGTSGGTVVYDRQ